ncbi:MAG: phospholipase D-like domain-containing protein [Myxococcota bacterium]
MSREPQALAKAKANAKIPAGIRSAADEKVSAQLLGNVSTPPPSPIDDHHYDHLPIPNDIDEAFETLPASSSGIAQTRRFADDNPLAWNMVLDLARSAEKTFDFSFFTIEKDPYGRAFLGAALYNQMRGVEVTGITDWNANARGRGFTSNGIGYDYLQEIAAFGAKIGVFNSPAKRIARLFREGPDYGLIGSDHDKIIVTDKGTAKAQGETGGRNIAGAYHQDPKDNPSAWRDDTLHIKGKEAVSGLAIAIEREFAGPAMKIVKPDYFNESSRARELLFDYAMMEEWVARPAFTEAEKAALRADPSMREGLAGKLVDAAEARMQAMIAKLPEDVKERIPAVLLPTENSRLMENAKALVNDLEMAGSRQIYEAHDGFTKAEVKIIDQTGAADAPKGTRYNEMAPAMLHLLEGANKEIVIQNPYVVLTEPQLLAMEKASKKGVPITIVTNSPESTDSAVTQGFFLNDWPSILARLPTARLFVATGDRKFHAKCFEIDEKVTGDTTYNADLLSGLINGEVGAISRSEVSAKDLKQRIQADLDNPANGFKEWKIQKDADNKAVLDAEGKPIIVEGPDQDVSEKLRFMYMPVQIACKALTMTEGGAPLKHPPLAEYLKNRGW